MFWNIFLNSLVLIVAILFVGWGISRFLERSSEKSSTSSNEEE